MSKDGVEIQAHLQGVDDRSYLALGLAQLPVWLDSMVGGDANYRIGGWARVDGRLDHHELRQSIQLVMARHDGLRVRVDPDKPRQWVDESSEPPFNVIECHDVDPEDALQIQLERFSSESMPLGDHPLFRIDLVETGPYSYLIWRLHHIIADHFSVRIALSHLFNAYDVVTSSGEVELTPGSSILETLAADAEYSQSANYKRDLAYWVDRFDPLPPALFETQPSATSLPAASHIVHRIMERDRFNAFTAATKLAGTLPQRALFALFTIALARRFAQTDLACGMLLHRRDRTNFHVVGMLTGFIPVRSQFESWWTITECVQAVSEQVDADLRHQRLPNDVLHRELGSPEHGLFDAMMSWMPADEANDTRSVIPGMVMSRIDTPDPSAITLNAQQDAKTGGLNYKIAINPDYAGTIDAEFIIDLLDEMIAIFIADGDCEFESLSPIPESERLRLSQLSQAPFPLVDASESATLCHLLAEFAQTQPDAPALIEALTGDDLASGRVATWRSYAELDADVIRLARVLQSVGVVADDVVGVCVERDGDLLTTLFAIWKVGATYLPLDANYPEERLSFMLDDANAKLVVVSGRAALKVGALGTQTLQLDTAEHQRLLNAVSTEPLAVSATAESLAYLIYTSGSTGKPKGVMVAHGQLMAFRNAITSVVKASSDDCILSAAAPIFDAFFMDLVVSLGMGARMVRLQARELAAPGYLADVAQRYAANYMDLTPSVWRAALSSGWQPGPDMRVVSGGEAIDAELTRLLCANGARLFNSYG
ncbi:MAG: AMP-binding protein, partial [Granulosicoccus sp.]